MVKLGRHPAHIHKMTEDERSARVLELQDELRLTEQEISQTAEAAQKHRINRVMGTEGQVVSEDAKAELKLAKDELAKMLAQFKSQTRGYCKKIHEAQVAVFDAQAKAGDAERRQNMILNGLAQNLATMVEHSVRYDPELKGYYRDKAAEVRKS
jgi:hypothetical protein